MMNATLLITRDSGFTDFIRRYRVMLDGEEIGLIKNNGKFECAIPSGRHTLEMKVDWCSSNAIEFEAGAGERVRFACGSNLRGWKGFKASKIIQEAPHEYIWLRQLSK